MTRQMIIEELLEAIRFRMPTWGFLPFTILHLQPKSIEISNIRGEGIEGDMVIFLLRTDYTTADALDYIRNTSEMEELSDPGKRELTEHFFCKFRDEKELSIWKQQRIAMALGIMQAEAKKLNLNLTEHKVDLSAVVALNQIYGLSPQCLFEIS
ncbi:MAG: hypothetical protein EOO85_13845 [Pedobacter sp.]|nr:MAG: hypothetical protein EOO85_13845 [Pedobacter sp.]